MQNILKSCAKLKHKQIPDEPGYRNAFSAHEHGCRDGLHACIPFTCALRWERRDGWTTEEANREYGTRSQFNEQGLFFVYPWQKIRQARGGKDMCDHYAKWTCMRIEDAAVILTPTHAKRHVDWSIHYPIFWLLTNRCVLARLGIQSLERSKDLLELKSEND